MQHKIKLLKGWSENELLDDIWTCWKNNQPVMVINSKILEFNNSYLTQLGIKSNNRTINFNSPLYNNLPTGFQLLLLTSGTTGAPKIVCLDKNSILFNVTTLYTHLNLTPKFTVYGIPPLFHAFGAVLNGLMSKIMGLKYLDSRKVKFEDLNSPILLSFIPNSIFKFIKNCPSTISGVSINGGDCLYKDHIDYLYKNLPNIQHTTGYGMTEAGPIITHTNIGDTLQARDIGRALPGVATKVNLNNILEFKSQGQAKAYFNYEEHKWQILDNTWISTGDIVKKHKQKFTFLGRTQWSINKNGETISPVLVEQKLEEILEYKYNCRVIPIKNNFTENLHLMVKGIENQDHRNYITQKLQALPTYFQPDTLEFVTDWPLSDSGKLNRGAA